MLFYFVNEAFECLLSESLCVFLFASRKEFDKLCTVIRI